MAKKAKLTHGQQRQVHKNHQKKLKQLSSSSVTTTQGLEQEKYINNDFSEARDGLVISCFGKTADIEDAHSKNIYRCHIRRTIKSLVCGDRVIWYHTEGSENYSGVVDAVQERRSILTRPDYYDGVRVMAANITQIIIVSAIEPAFSSNILDRYLIVAENLEIKPVILINKTDLLTDEALNALKTELDAYEKLDYSLLYLNTLDEAEQNSNKQLFLDCLKNNTSIFVGQSGVGKSSLVNFLLPDINTEVQILSENSGLGQHTTTVAKLYHLPIGGALIDSPGIREFGMWHLDANEVMNGFIEFRPYFGQCKFRDCRHQHDPKCAIVKAVEDGNISKMRYQNYLSILASIDELRSNRSFIAHKK